jgi:HTH-type transcriptional regulator / antitoxin HigA
MTTATRKKITGAKSYTKLVSAFPPRLIHSEQERKSTFEAIESLMAVKNPSADQLDYLELLSTLLEQHESIKFPTPQVSTASLLAHLMEAGGHSQASIAAATGIKKSIVSEILGGKRGLSIENMKRLAKLFTIDAGLFLQCQG